MAELPGLTWPVILTFCNLILSSAIVITAFSLLGYMLTHNLRSPVAQTFSALVACVLVVFAGDVVLPRVESFRAAVLWLRVQWIGIALVPATYLHFSDAVLRTTRHFSARRRWVVFASYIFSLILVVLALFTNLLVYAGDFSPPINYLSAGPLFWLFAAFFLSTAAYGGFNVFRARRRCLTPAAHRRMTYLTLSFAAPGLGVFPYLVTSGLAGRLSAIPLLSMTLVGNFAVGAMLVVMAYSVAYYGVLTPDRVVKHDMIHYLLRGPIVGIVVIVVMLVMPRFELILGLPRDTALIFAVVGVIVLGQLAVGAAKPWIDKLIYRQDREEISWIQTLDRRLLTSSDLEQFLRNVVMGLCELLRVDTGFVIVQTERGAEVTVSVGEAETGRQFAQTAEASQALQSPAPPPQGGGQGTSNSRSGNGASSPPPRFHVVNGIWFSPLHSQDEERTLGILGIRARNDQMDLDDEEAVAVDVLLSQAASALSDRYVQEGVFATLQRILPNLELIQEWRSAVRYAAPIDRSGAALRGNQVDQGPWQQAVKDALSHYWGGPKLTESPLAELRLVRRALSSQDGNIPRALRAVLQEAIERQRPEGERHLTASEWLLYNILELRFIQGKRVRDIANRLAMSESDLYRKQRAAVAEVAKTLAEMEAAAEGQEPSGIEPIAAESPENPLSQDVTR